MRTGIRVSALLGPACGLLILLALLGLPAMAAPEKPGADEAINLLKAGNARFVQGKPEHPRSDIARANLAAKSNQADYAYATILSCSDSRVPVEYIFDAGIMDLFVVRVAGNVCDTDEIGSIEYGLAHVKTPVLVILGHSQCGAVTAVTQAIQGKGHALERNIPPLVKNIEPAVKRAMKAHPDAEEKGVVPFAIEENVYQSMRDLFVASPAVRQLVKSGRTKVIGAIYDVGTGSVAWLPPTKTVEILDEAEADPRRATEAMAGEEGGQGAHGSTGTKH